MSRALDDDVKKAIRHGDHEQIFTNIAGALSQRHAELLEIELLGRSHMADADAILLQDGPAIAVPKLRLVQAFIFARALLYEKKDLSRATAVMLLMDPEHLTAANTRKRILQDGIDSGTDVETRIRDELYFVDSLLTSRLHRHTKSPTLWGHRQWLMQRCQEHGLKIDATSIMTTVISVAAERHPRNYYAWLHARYLTTAVSETAALREGDKVKDKDKGDLAEMLEAAKSWALRHHDDVSGWAFLMFFLDRHPEYAGPVVSETARLAASFHWRNESVWYFLRNMAARAWCDGDWREEVEATRLALLGGAERGSDGERVLEQAASWVQAYTA
ncbi:hypothetical protein ACHAPX_003094 [Trichoderma viride]